MLGQKTPLRSFFMLLVSRPALHAPRRLYGAQNVTPKFHVLMHFSEFIRLLWAKKKKRALPNCWPCERKHRLPKRWINPITNRSIRFDRSAFRDVLGFSLQQLADHDNFLMEGLVEPVSFASPEMQAVMVPIFGPNVFHTARVAQVCLYERVHVGDVVEGRAADGTRFVGEVRAHCSVAKDCFSILATWPCIEQTDDSSSWDYRSSSLCMVHTADILTACIHCKLGHRVVVLSSPRSRVPEDVVAAA